MYYGMPQDADLNLLLSKCTQNKLLFDAGLVTLKDNLTKIPKEIDDIGDWVIKQRALLRNEYALRSEIVDLETNNLTSIFARKILNKVSEFSAKLKENTMKMRRLVEYKGAIALWLGVHGDKEKMRLYSDELPRLFPNEKMKKGYVISFPVFEEMENPLVSRDWVGLTTTSILSDALKGRISYGLIEPIHELIKKNGAYYADLNVPPFDVKVDERKSDSEMENILKDATDKTNALIAEVIEKEAEFLGNLLSTSTNSAGSIFGMYETLSKDITTEIRAFLVGQSSDIQKKWLECTEDRGAIQTKIKVIESYFNQDNLTEANKILADLDGIFAQVPISTVEEVQHSSKVEDFYTKINHLKMLELYYKRQSTLGPIEEVKRGLQRLHESLGNLEASVLTSLQTAIEKDRTALSEKITKMKAEAVSVEEKKRIEDIIQPKVDAVMAKSPSDIPRCIEIKKELGALVL